jgi:RHS repeat-associated protein
MGLPALQIIPEATKREGAQETTQPFLRVIDGGRVDPLPENRVKGKKGPEALLRLVVLGSNSSEGLEKTASLGDNKRKGVAFAQYSYQYDKNGNRTSQEELNDQTTETTTYIYDRMNRLKSYTLTDALGNQHKKNYTYEGYNRKTENTFLDAATKEEKSFTYDETNWLTQVNVRLHGENGSNTDYTVSYTFDDNGNTLKKTDSRTPNEPTNFTYSARDRLVQVTKGQTGAETIQGQFDYNHAGMRVRHYQSDRGNVDYFYDDGAVIEERNADSNSLLAYYVYAERLIALAQPTGKQYYHHDGMGSTIALTDAAGAIKKNYHLDPWGNIRRESGTSDNRNIFTGKEHDKKTGLVYFGARYYDPEIGRFITQDTYLGQKGVAPSLHRYLYAYSNPMFYIDLDGHSSIPTLEEIRNSGFQMSEMFNPWESIYKDLDFTMDSGESDAAGSGRLVLPPRPSFGVGDAQPDILLGDDLAYMTSEAIDGAYESTEQFTNGAAGKFTEISSYLGHAIFSGQILGDIFDGLGDVWNQGFVPWGKDPVGTANKLADQFMDLPRNIINSTPKQQGEFFVEMALGWLTSKALPLSAVKAKIPSATTLKQGLKTAAGDIKQGLRRLATDETGGIAIPDKLAGKLGTKGVPKLLSAPKTIKHHIFNKFRGKSPASQKYRDFFGKHGIKVDKFTIRISEHSHKTLIHKAGNNWTTSWKRWIDANPNATTKEVYQFGGRMMDEFGVGHVPLVPYR